MRPVIVQTEPLRGLAEALLQAMGAPAEAAAEVAGHLVRANLSGQDAHGVARLPDYAALADSGELVPGARPSLVREAPAAALFDAGCGLGQHAAAVALRWCLSRAGGTGVAVAAVRRAADLGRLADYAERAAEAGALAIVTAGAAGRDAGHTMLHGGRTRFFGANPWAFGVPGRTRPLAFEASASTVSAAEVLLARAKGEDVPPDCLYDRFGRPSTDPADLAADGGLVPLGGAVAGLKGVGLAFASALFGSLAMGGLQPAGGTVGGAFVAVVDPGAFGDRDGYRDLVEAALASARSTRPGGGRSEVLLPGDAESRARAERSRTGVRLPETTWSDLAATAARLGVPLPEPPAGS